MNPALRATEIVVDPTAAWARVEQESNDQVFQLGLYVAALALIPPLSGFFGASIMGAATPAAGLVRAPWFDGAFGAIFLYAASFVAVFVLAFFINVVAPLFGGTRSFDAALKLAVYSFTPVWLAGIFLLTPGLRFLTLTGLYGVYVLALGLPRLMKLPKARLYVALSAVCAFAMIVGAVIAQRAIFPSSGI